MPSIATWWCGQPRRARTSARLARRGRDRRRVRRSGSGLRRPAQHHRFATRRRRSARALREAIDERGVDYVGQDIVRLSTTPRWENGQARAAPFRAARLCRGDAGRLARDAGRLLPHFRQVRRARRLDGRGRRIGRRLGAQRQAGRDDEPAAVAGKGPHRAACSAICRAAPPTICSGSAAISNARRRRCGWCAASARARSIPTRPPIARASRWRS